MKVLLVWADGKTQLLDEGRCAAGAAWFVDTREGSGPVDYFRAVGDATTQDTYQGEPRTQGIAVFVQRSANDYRMYQQRAKPA